MLKHPVVYKILVIVNGMFFKKMPLLDQIKC